MARVYATISDYSVVIGAPAPEGIASHLAAASELVEYATRNDLYETDLQGFPVKETLRDAMRSATCVQAAFWVENGINPNAGLGALKPIPIETGIASGTIKYESMSVRNRAREKSIDTLTPRAWRLLRNEGLGSSGVGLW